MNREFKFRLWSKSENCFVNPNILEVWDESGKMTPFQFVKTGKLDPIYMPVENYVIQQYTGLTDANDNPICEGDILIQNFIKSGSIPVTGVIGQVLYEADHGGYIFQWKRNGPNQNYINLNCDVAFESVIVGNIFEHKHLLEK